MEEKQVLLVDDSISLHTMIEMFLRQNDNPHYQLFSVVSAHEMFSYLDQQAISIVLLDIGLSDGNGLLLTKTIKQTHPEIAVVIITAKLGDEHAQAALEAGATDFLSKPFDGQSLLQCLNRISSSHNTPSRI